MNKRDFLDAVHHEWDTLSGALRKVHPHLVPVPKFLGEWSIKDMIGHITSWEEECLERIEQMRTKQAVRGLSDDAVHRWNREHVEAKRFRSVEQIMDDFDTVHKRLLKELESIAEGELVFKDGIEEWLIESTSAHYSEHRAVLEKVLSESAQTH
ncbi:MAG TPA: DinB family protein [Bacteroidota bacterium]